MTNGRGVAVALFCFSGKKAAATHQHALQEGLRATGDNVLQTTILQVDHKHRASVHDTRRVLAGTHAGLAVRFADLRLASDVDLLVTFALR